MATLQRKFLSNRAKAVRRNAAGSKQGAGDDRHMIAGSTGSGSAEYLYRSYVRFAPVWTGVKRVVKIELAIRTMTTSTHFTVGRKPKTRVERLVAAFADGTNGENVWTSGEYEWPNRSGYVEFESPINPSTGTPQNSAWVFVDVTNLLKPIVPKSIVMPDGSAGGGLPFYGLSIRAPGTEKDDAQRMIFHSFDVSGSTFDPYLLVTYDEANKPPLAPTLTDPPITDVSLGDVFIGAHSDPDGDPMAGRIIEVWKKDETGDAGKVAVWTLPPSLQSAASGETQTGIFSVPLSLAIASLKLQTDYEWRAKTQDPAGLWGPFSAVRALRITSSVPTAVAISPGNVAAMSNAKFGGTYSDPENDSCIGFHLQMQPGSGSNDAAFADASAYIWDTGESIPTADEATANLIAREYAGAAIDAGPYAFRLRVQDSTGAWSGWSYATFTLTADFDPEPGTPTLTTQIARIAPVRIALYGMGANRGPGALIGHIDDPMDVGASAFLNGPGEVYFSLPALHPYCPYIEPHQTHFAVEQYYGDRYHVKFAGIVTDFDADADSVVFYGADYLGLLLTAVDERYNPDKPAVQAPTGSYYVNKTLDSIIKDQLTYHKGLTDSPVKFINIGTGGSFAVLAERATIYSTYAEALPFISGLIDSHKQGTGREARFYARPTNPTYTAWEWALIDNWGKDRPNIRLEWGGLLNDFRVVALGDFGTRVLAVGQKRGEVKVYRAVGTGGLAESQWGRRAKTAFFPDIIDQNDLQRRANEAASVLSKVGKRMALAIRADMLSPFDGWDLGDSIVVDIERGVVDTSQYGSGGLWTILGVEWRYYPDGHTDLTLTILPKKSATPPDPDLIPSVNPGLPDEWQVGYGVPSLGYGFPPTATPDPPVLLDSTLTGPSDEWRYRTGFTAPAAGQLKFNPGNTQLLIHKTAESGFSRSAELLALVIGSLIRVRASNGLDRIGRITNAVDSGSYVTLTYTSLFGVGSLPTQNTPVIVNARRIGTYSYTPPSDESIIAEKYMDLNTGCVYEIDESTGMYTEVYCPETGGGTTPLPPDTTPPPKPMIKSTSSESTTQDDGTNLTNITAVVGFSSPPSGLIDLDHYTMESTRFTVGVPPVPDWTLATQWVTQSADLTGTLDTNVIQPTVHSATEYHLRVYAFDSWGNRSVVSDTVSIISARDTSGPPQPTGVVATAGMSTIGVRWDAIPVEDLAYVEVQWREAAGPGSWVSAQSGGTVMVIAGLTNDVTYDVRVRSVDTSGNTRNADGTTEIAVENPEAGWVGGIADYREHALGTTPLTYWRLGESNPASPALDEAVGYDGTYGPGTIAADLGPPGMVTDDPATSARLDWTDATSGGAMMQRSLIPFSDPDKFSASIVIKPGVLEPGGWQSCWLLSGWGPAADQWVGLLIGPGGTAVYHSASGFIGHDASAAPTLDEVIDVLFIHNVTATSLYINGVLMATGTSPLNTTSPRSFDLTVGDLGWWGTVGRYLLQESIFWDRALTPAEAVDMHAARVAALYSPLQATPTAIPGNALVWDEAIIEDIFAGMIDADWITAGTLTVGQEADGQAAAIEVVNPLGEVIGRWSTEGIEVLDPANAGYKLVIDEASLSIYTGADTGTPVKVVSLSPLGIDAASITFGSARGGHNLVQNSSFELGRFAVSAVVNQTWDLAADWNATRVGADTNVTTGASALTMTTI